MKNNINYSDIDDYTISALGKILHRQAIKEISDVKTTDRKTIMKVTLDTGLYQDSYISY